MRRRRLFLVAAAAVLIVGGPLAALALTKGGSQEAPAPPLANAVRAQFDEGEKAASVDPETKVSAGVSMAARPWGTQVVLELANVKGPLTCDLVAVGKDGKRQTVTTWAVPRGRLRHQGQRREVEPRAPVRGGRRGPQPRRHRPLRDPDPGGRTAGHGGRLSPAACRRPRSSLAHAR